MKEWRESELHYLAYVRCTSCKGTGVRRRVREELVPCRCALRAMFRACFERFRLCHERGKFKQPAAFDRTPSGKTNRGTWGRKEEEYLADFELVAKRTLDPWHYRLFRWYFLLGADWRLCAKRLRIDRGNLYHAVYRIEERLGFAFATIEPYALYPPRDYFALHFRQVSSVAPGVGTPNFAPPKPREPKPLGPPRAM